MFTDSRVLPASGAFPKPGQDISGTIWQQYMRGDEIAMFCFDARSGQLVTPKGEVPESPIQEHCVAFRSLYMARLSARGCVRKNPRMMAVLYDKSGRWLATMSREGESRRNPGLGLAWVLFQFPLLAFLGTTFILAAFALRARLYGAEPLHWERWSAQEWNGVIFLGLLLGAAGRLIFEVARRRLLVHNLQPAREPIGSPARDRFYAKLARTNSKNLLTPLDISFAPTKIDWPSPEKYEEWTSVLRQEGFEQLGSFLIQEVRQPVEFWFHSHDDLTGVIAVHPQVGMWLNVSTRYEDWSSFGTSNKKATPLDPHPTKKTVYLGPEASAESVIERARNDRPVGGVRRRPTRENVLPDYVVSWRQYVEWRRSRGTTAEEFKRIAEAKARVKAAGTSWL